MVVMHVIVGLSIGGAEMMLKRLIEHQHKSSSCLHFVVSLTDIGKVGLLLQGKGVDVEALGMRGFFDIPRVLWRLARIMRSKRPDIIQTWMYHADFLGGLAAWIVGNPRVIWGVRCTEIPQRRVSTTGLIVFISSLLSWFVPRKIVCCAEAAQIAHSRKGYDNTKMVVIPNGYDLDCYNSSPEFRQKSREAFGFTNEDIIVGIVGRFDPLKDHKNFIRAATLAATNVSKLKFLMVGRGIDSKTVTLDLWLKESGISHKFILAGERNDIPSCLAAMDVFCLSSSDEGFPNVVCEAMAMKVPCTVTDAGAASEIVGSTGIVVAPKDSCALAEALETMINLGASERSRLGELARERVSENYSIEIASTRFEKLYHLEMLT